MITTTANHASVSNQGSDEDYKRVSVMQNIKEETRMTMKRVTKQGKQE